MMQIKLTCSVCGNSGDNGIISYAEFDLAGYGDAIDWSDCEDRIPDRDERKWWMRSERIPQVGERRVIQVKHPFYETDERDFWSFYQPALTHINGVDLHIEEIDRYAFVRCQLSNILSIDNNQPWVQVLVKEVILLADAPNELPLRSEESAFLEKLYSFSPYYYKPYGNWEYYFGSAQGDLGNWFFIYKTALDVRLISFGEWSFHQDAAYLGNLVISDKTYKSLTKKRKLRN
jgi:hypothetical protein